MFSLDGARTSGSVRPVLPNVKAAGCENTEVLKYWFRRWETGPLSSALWPLLFGRNVLIPQPVQLFAAVTARGNPVWYMKIPFTCHPPMAASTARFQFLPSALPRPKGNSYVPLIPRRRERSFDETDRCCWSS